jgi:hypothetical protein
MCWGPGADWQQREDLVWAFALARVPWQSAQLLWSAGRCNCTVRCCNTDTRRFAQIFLGLKNRAVQAINCGSGAVIREFGGYDADFVGLDIAGEYADQPRDCLSFWGGIRGGRGLLSRISSAISVQELARGATRLLFGATGCMGCPCTVVSAWLVFSC